MAKSTSTLSKKRIFISLMIFVMIPISARLLNIFANEYDIALMASFNILGFILLCYDWNLFAIHYNRAKYHLDDLIKWTIRGLVLIAILIFINDNFLNGTLILPSTDSLIAFGYARPGMWIAYSFVQAMVINIIYKVISDPLSINNKELQVILLSSIIFGFLYLLLFVPFALETWVRTYLYNVLLISILSYLYDGSHSFIPGILSMGTMYLLMMVL